MTDQFIEIRSQTGQFYLNSNEETREIYINIPKYDYEEKITFRPSKMESYHEQNWFEYLDEVVVAKRRNIKGKKKQERLDEILTEHEDEIKSEWEEYRKEQLQKEIEQRKEELNELE